MDDFEPVFKIMAAAGIVLQIIKASKYVQKFTLDDLDGITDQIKAIENNLA